MVEVLKDVAFRIVPLTKRDAREMIKEIKGISYSGGIPWTGTCRRRRTGRISVEGLRFR